MATRPPPPPPPPLERQRFYRVPRGLRSDWLARGAWTDPPSTTRGEVLARYCEYADGVEAAAIAAEPPRHELQELGEV